MTNTLWLAFQDLKTGDRFRFVQGLVFNPKPVDLSDAVYTKATRGWFTDNRGRKFRTGKYTHVAKEMS